MLASLIFYTNKIVDFHFLYNFFYFFFSYFPFQLKIDWSHSLFSRITMTFVSMIIFYPFRLVCGCGYLFAGACFIAINAYAYTFFIFFLLKQNKKKTQQQNKLVVFVHHGVCGDGYSLIVAPTLFVLIFNFFFIPFICSLILQAKIYKINKLYGWAIQFWTDSIIERFSW